MSETADRNRQFYDEEASQYDKIRYSSVKGQRVDRFHRKVLADLAGLDKRRYDSVLEIGCGTGRFLPFFSDYATKVTGIDASEGMLGVAEKRIMACGLENIEVLEGDALNLEFADDSFDLVYSILVLNLIPDFANVFREVSRVLAPGGCFLFSVPNLQSLYYPAGFIVNSRGKAFGKNDSGHRRSHWFTKSEVDTALASAGLVRKASFGQPPWTGFIDNATALSGSKLAGMLSKSVYIKAVAG